MIWFKNIFSSQTHSDKASMHLADIPRAPAKGIAVMSYPQASNAIPFHRLNFFQERYAELLRELVDSVPLADGEIERYLMPIITGLYQWGHLLPASENHHHAGVGGLFVHSLESSIAAVSIAKSTEFPKLGSSRDHYLNQYKWQVAAAIALLIHDLGKIFDVQVTNEDDSITWNPTELSLVDWLENLKIKEYYAHWNPERKHKKHELTSISIAHRYLLTDQCITFLGHHCGATVIRAIEEAIVFGTGPLANVLKEAEQQSISKDLSTQHKQGLGLTTVSLPRVQPILTAIRELIQQSKWTCNQRDSQIFITTKGIFLDLSSYNAQCIREMASHFGIRNVPGTTTGILRILKDAGLLKPRLADPNDFFWPLRWGKNDLLKNELVLFKDPIYLFPEGHLPQTISVSSSTKEDQQPISSDEMQASRNPNSDSVTDVYEDHNVTVTTTSSQTESVSDLSAFHNFPSSREDRCRFLEQFTQTIIQHMQTHDLLTPDVEEINGILRARSAIVFHFLFKRGVDHFLFVTYLRQRRNHPKLSLVDGNSFFELQL